MNADVLANLMRQCRRLTAEQSAICRSPTAGEKPVISGRKRPSLPCSPPADAPGGASVPPHFHGKLARISHRVSTADGESRRPAVLVANRAPRRSATTTASPDSQQTQRILALRRPRHVVNPRGLSAPLRLRFSALRGGWVLRLCDFAPLCLRRGRVELRIKN
jgi:hypothetical protein